MHGNTTGEDLIKRLISLMEKMEPTSEKLSGLSTDGAPAEDAKLNASFSHTHGLPYTWLATRVS